MVVTYEYPVVHFFGDDLEDSEKVEKEGQIRLIQTSSEPYEAIVNAEGCSFHILFGSQCNGNFLCIPNWHTGCELSYLEDVFWNQESIMGQDESFGYENATAIAYALKELNMIISR